MKEKKCSKKGCKGTVDLKKTVYVHSGCYNMEPTHPCKVCGTLHHEGTFICVTHKSGDNAVFLKDGRVIVGKNDITDYCHVM